jgi:hypothetical protein
MVNDESVLLLALSHGPEVDTATGDRAEMLLSIAA